MSAEKPSWDEVFKYAKDVVHIKLGKFTIPEEQKEEVVQEAYLKVFKSYERIDPEKSWKGFVSSQVRGAILDYFRGGDGFQENKTGSTFMCTRLKPTDNNGKPFGLDEVLGHYGVYNKLDENYSRRIHWGLLAKLCSKEDSLYIFVKHVLLGFTVTEISEESSLSRERCTMQVQQLLERFDHPNSRFDKCVDQMIFALGLSEVYGTPNEDNGWGHEFVPVDFAIKNKISNKNFTPQYELFDSGHNQKVLSERLDRATIKGVSNEATN